MRERVQFGSRSLIPTLETQVLGEIASIEGVCRVVRDAQLRHLSLLPSGRRTSVPVHRPFHDAASTDPPSHACLYHRSLRGRLPSRPPANSPTPNTGRASTPPSYCLPERSPRSSCGTFRGAVYCRGGRSASGSTLSRLEGYPTCRSSPPPTPPLLAPLPDPHLAQVRDIEFECARDGQLAGFAVFMQASLLAADAPPEIETWAWDEEEQREVCRGDWAQQVLVLPGGGCHVSRGDAVRLRAEVDTTPMQPVYCYRAELRKAGNTGEWREIGEVALDKPNFG